MKNSFKTALGGLITALGTVLLLLFSAIPFLEYTIPAAAGLLVLLMQAQTSKIWAFGVYIATSLLCIFVVPNKEAAAMYIALFGLYPVIKSFFDKLPKWAAYIVKSVFFSADVIGVYYILIKVFGISQELTEDLTKFTLPILMICGLVAFLVYDRALTLIEKKYTIKYKTQVDRILRGRK